MDKYLLQILKEINTIIIPGLGALTITNAATGEIMFMSYLKYDDGKLSQYISEKEGMSDIDAKNLIAKYVREVEAKLNIGESYDMYQFGSFKKNSSGELEFTQWNSSKNEVEPMSDLTSEPELDELTTQNPENSSFEEPIVIDTEKEHKLSKKAIVDEIIETEDSDKVEKTETEKISEEPIEQPVIEEFTETEYVPEIMEETIPPISTYTEDDQWKDDLDVLPIGAKIERPKKPILEKTQKDKKRKGAGFYVMLTILVLLIGGTLTLGMFYNSFERLFHSKSTEVAETIDSNPEEKVEKQDKDAPIEKIDEEPEIETVESNASDTQVSEPEPETQGMIETSTGRVNPAQPFHLIAGAFKEKNNAERFRDRLRENGNSNSEIIGEFDGLFVVSVSSHANMEEARESQKTNTTISKSWIFRWP